jgi:hypothetical protein
MGQPTSAWIPGLKGISSELGIAENTVPDWGQHGTLRTTRNMREHCSGAKNSREKLWTAGNAVLELGMAKDGKEYCSLPGTVEDSSEQVGIVFQSRGQQRTARNTVPKLWTAGKTVPELGTVQDSSEQEGTVFRSRVQKKQKGALCISYEQQQTLLQGLGQLRTARDRR